MNILMKRLSSLFLCLPIATMLCASLSGNLVVQAANDVKPSTEEYQVELFGRGSFVCNEKAVAENAYI